MISLLQENIPKALKKNLMYLVQKRKKEEKLNNNIRKEIMMRKKHVFLVS